MVSDVYMALLLTSDKPSYLVSPSTDMTTYKLTYFDSRGRGELCRILFAVAGQKVEDVRISMADWANLKPTTPFGQLPVLEIDGKPFTQSSALAAYLANEFGYYGQSNLDKLLIDQICCLVADFIAEVYKIYLEKDEGRKAELQKNFFEVVAPKYLGLLEGQLKNNGTGFFVGSSPTLADLCVYDFIFNVRARSPPGVLDNFPLIVALLNKIENLDKLKSYLANRKVTPF